MSQQLSKQEDQAEELRKLLNEVESIKDPEMNKSIESEEVQLEQREVDILNLPPRKEVHGNKKQHTHIKISLPFRRFILIIFLLIIILIGVYYLFGGDIPQLMNNVMDSSIN